MEFDSPEVMKDFPGLYAPEKKCSNDSDYSDEADKVMKKDILSKRKDKKDKKDKERGYAALEGESSAEESNCKSSPSKNKKSKSFKFTTKSKEKREKSREKDKDKESTEKKKERDKKTEKKIEKEKGKKIKQTMDEAIDIAEALPIFGVSLEVAVERSRCHDGIDIPLPVRQCIDYVESVGLSFENVYKISGTKSKVLQIKKMYQQRQNVNLADYDIPTATSLLKMFLRDLPEPLFTNELLIRFEEAGAILNLNTREKHLKILVDNLHPLNKLLLSWLICHLDNITLNEKINKMNKQNLSAALNHTFHSSSRLLNALLVHRNALFPDTAILKYIPPLGSGAHLPEEPELMEIELKKQESLLTQIHTEMNIGCISKEREELLWEVQRIITQLKRKLKTHYKEKETIDKVEEKMLEPEVELYKTEPSNEAQTEQETAIPEESVKEELPPPLPSVTTKAEVTDKSIKLLLMKNAGLIELKKKLQNDILNEKNEILKLKGRLTKKPTISTIQNTEGLDEIMALLRKENQILQIKKINLVRNIIEQQENLIDLRAKMDLFPNC